MTSIKRGSADSRHNRGKSRKQPEEGFQVVPRSSDSSS
jgi:hypothetical protein